MAAPVGSMWDELPPLYARGQARPLSDVAAVETAARQPTDATAPLDAAHAAPLLCTGDGDELAAAAAHSPTAVDAAQPPAPPFRCLDARHHSSCKRCVARARSCCATRASASRRLMLQLPPAHAAARRRLPRAPCRTSSSSATCRRRTVRARRARRAWRSVAAAFVGPVRMAFPTAQALSLRQPVVYPAKRRREEAPRHADNDGRVALH